MLTPIILLVLMTAPYLISRVLKAVTKRDGDLRGAGAIGLTLLFILTGIGHFTDTAAMAQMLPSWVPGRVAIVYVTGVLEFAIAAGFFFRKTRWMTGWIAATILVLFFPANIYAAIHQVPMGGHAWGPVYLLIRGPLQLIILAWVYWFTIRIPNK
ncbi:MAG: DoxX family protein [Candidatus Binatia bacterium]